MFVEYQFFSILTEDDTMSYSLKFRLMQRNRKVVLESFIVVTHKSVYLYETSEIQVVSLPC